LASTTKRFILIVFACAVHSISLSGLLSGFYFIAWQNWDMPPSKTKGRTVLKPSMPLIRQPSI
jgi:hypothetical protein